MLTLPNAIESSYFYCIVHVFCVYIANPLKLHALSHADTYTKPVKILASTP